MSDSSGDDCALQIDIGGGVGDSEDAVTNSRKRKSDTVLKPRGTWRPGDIVWAKVTGFNYWPAKVLDSLNDTLVPDWLKPSPKPSYILARFFGTYDIQWVSSSSAVAFEKGLKRKFHNKSKRKVFTKAVKEVRSYINEGVIPEGLTLRPPDPPESDEPVNSPKKPSSHTPASTYDLPSLTSNQYTYTITATDPNDLPPIPSMPTISSRTSRRRKGSTPRRLSSSSLHSTEDTDPSHPSDLKKVKLNNVRDEAQVRSNEQASKQGVQPFTCGPLPLSSTTGQE